MAENLELIIHINKDASMGVFTTKTLLEKLKNKDNKIKGLVSDIKNEYESFYSESSKILADNKINKEENGIVSKMMSSTAISKEVKADNSDSAIADMLIEGLTMGVVEIEKKIKAYDEKVDKEYLKLAKKFMKFQEKRIEELKKYL